MTNKVRIVYRPDGTVAVIYPALKSKRPDETEEQWLERVFSKSMGPETDLHGCEYDDMTREDIPTDRKSRVGWERNTLGKGIVVNQAKVIANREIEDAAILVQRKMREMALEQLKAEGKVPEHVTLPKPEG